MDAEVDNISASHGDLRSVEPSHGAFHLTLLFRIESSIQKKSLILRIASSSSPHFRYANMVSFAFDPATVFGNPPSGVADLQGRSTRRSRSGTADVFPPHQAKAGRARPTPTDTPPKPHDTSHLLSTTFRPAFFVETLEASIASCESTEEFISLGMNSAVLGADAAAAGDTGVDDGDTAALHDREPTEAEQGKKQRRHARLAAYAEASAAPYPASKPCGESATLRSSTSVSPHRSCEPKELNSTTTLRSCTSTSASS